MTGVKGSPDPASDYVAADAFGAAVADHHRRLAGFAYLLTGDRTVAEDLVAEAYARVWPRFRRHEVDDVERYLRRVVANLATGRLRRLRLERREQAHRRLDWRRQPLADPSEPERLTGERDQLWPAIWRLPADQRAVIVLRIVEDRSEQEVAALLGVRPGTVKSRLARGLGALRTALEDEAGTRPGDDGAGEGGTSEATA